MPSYAERVLDALGPGIAERAGDLLPDVVEAYCEPASSTDALLEPTPQGWPAVVDLATSPYPAVIARATGTTVPVGLTPEQVRAYVTERASWRRGTPGAMLAAAREAYPTGHISLIERDGSAWRTTIRLYAGEATEADRQRVIAAVSPHKPVGIVLSVVRLTGATWAHVAEHHGPTWAAQAGRFPTWAAMTGHTPEEGTTP